MDNLWTPWRFHYLKSASDKDECVFCRILSDGMAGDPEHFILVRGVQCFVILNRFPYTSGHLMVVLFRHVATLQDCTESEINEMIHWARTCEGRLREVYSPDGFNVGLNIGHCAGAGVAGHLHMHVVPRWTGDANFVSVIGQTRTIPEELEQTYAKLLPYFQNR
jgi:ATP adenylyltransferase